MFSLRSARHSVAAVAGTVYSTRSLAIQHSNLRLLPCLQHTLFVNQVETSSHRSPQQVFQQCPSHAVCSLTPKSSHSFSSLTSRLAWQRDTVEFGDNDADLSADAKKSTPIALYDDSQEAVDQRARCMEKIKKAARERMPISARLNTLSMSILRSIPLEHQGELCREFGISVDEPANKKEYMEALATFIRLDSLPKSPRGRPLHSNNANRAKVKKLVNSEGIPLDQWGLPKESGNDRESNTSFATYGSSGSFQAENMDEHGYYPLDEDRALEEFKRLRAAKAEEKEREMNQATPDDDDNDDDDVYDDVYDEDLQAPDAWLQKVSISHVKVSTNQEIGNMQPLSRAQQELADQRREYFDVMRSNASMKKTSKLLQMAMGMPSNARLYAYAVTPEEVGSLLQTTQIEDVTIMYFDPEHTQFTTSFVFGTGRSPRHLYGAANAVSYLAKQRYTEAGWDQRITVDGVQGSTWIAVDTGAVGVHIMTKEEREFRDLESLWESKALKVVKLPNKKVYDTIHTARVPPTVSQLAGTNRGEEQ